MILKKNLQNLLLRAKARSLLGHFERTPFVLVSVRISSVFNRDVSPIIESLYSSWNLLKKIAGYKRVNCRLCDYICGGEKSGKIYRCKIKIIFILRRFL